MAICLASKIMSWYLVGAHYTFVEWVNLWRLFTFESFPINGLEKSTKETRFTLFNSVSTLVEASLGSPSTRYLLWSSKDSGRGGGNRSTIDSGLCFLVSRCWKAQNGVWGGTRGVFLDSKRLLPNNNLMSSVQMNRKHMDSISLETHMALTIKHHSDYRGKNTQQGFNGVQTFENASEVLPEPQMGLFPQNTWGPSCTGFSTRRPFPTATCQGHS